MTSLYIEGVICASRSIGDSAGIMCSFGLSHDLNSCVYGLYFGLYG